MASETGFEQFLGKRIIVDKLSDNFPIFGVLQKITSTHLILDGCVVSLCEIKQVKIFARKNEAKQEEENGCRI